VIAGTYKDSFKFARLTANALQQSLTQFTFEDEPVVRDLPRQADVVAYAHVSGNKPAPLTHLQRDTPRHNPHARSSFAFRLTRAVARRWLPTPA